LTVVVDFVVVLVFFFVVPFVPAATRVACFGRLWTVVFLPAASEVVASANTASIASSSIFIDFRIM